MDKLLHDGFYSQGENNTSAKQKYIDLGLSPNPKYGDISNYHDLEKLSPEKCQLLSLGLGDATTIRDISKIPELWKLTDDECIKLSKWQTL